MIQNTFDFPKLTMTWNLSKTLNILLVFSALDIMKSAEIRSIYGFPAECSKILVDSFYLFNIINQCCMYIRCLSNVYQAFV